MKPVWSARALAGCTATALVAAMTACGGSGGGSSGSGDGDVSLRIAINSNAAALPAKVADAKGLFAKQHLKVTFTTVQNIATLPTALGKSFDIALTVPTSAISSAAQGIAVVPIAGATLQDQKNSQSGIMVSGSSGITSASGLKGATIGVPNTTGTLHLATLAWLDKAGVPPASIKTVQVDAPSQADQLKAGRVGAVEAVAPFSALMEAAGDRNLGDPYSALGPEIGALAWVSAKDWATSNEKAVKGFRAALTEALAYIAGNAADAKKILQAFTGVNDKVLEATKLPTFTTEVRRANWETWLDTMRKYGDFSKSFDLNTMFPSS